MKKIILLSLTIGISFGCSKNKETEPKVQDPFCLVTEVVRYQFDSSDGNRPKERYSLSINYDNEQRPSSVYIDLADGERLKVILNYTDDQIKISIDDPDYSDFGLVYHLNKDNLIERAENLMKEDLSVIYTYNNTKQLIEIKAFEVDDPTEMLTQELSYNSLGIEKINARSTGGQGFTIAYDYDTNSTHIPVQYSSSNEGYFQHLEFMAAVIYFEPITNIVEILYHLGYFGETPKYAIKSFVVDGKKDPMSYYQITEGKKVIETSLGRIKTTFDYKCN